jgi:hypothetical protein
MLKNKQGQENINYLELIMKYYISKELEKSGSIQTGTIRSIAPPELSKMLPANSTMKRSLLL